MHSYTSLLVQQRLEHDARTGGAATNGSRYPRHRTGERDRTAHTEFATSVFEALPMASRVAG
ncbi:hypothetical protein ABZ319_38200 [Nocardia sp. NPDC005978]|uniref:hypothetical protein n=1 Tax=Nocardia sp. NPDC005978 TaxID=3156725 RepID=UPI0033AA227F